MTPRSLPLLQLHCFLFFVIALCGIAGNCAADQPATQPAIRLDTEADRVKVVIGDQTVTHYVFDDAELSRPYFAHVKTLSGKQVSRNFPPREGVDKTDHANMHPGIWLSFGDLNGHDYWRLKAKTQHVRFLVEPKVETGVARFKVLNKYLATNSPATDRANDVCEQACEVRVAVMDSGCYTICVVSDFKATTGDLRFGDQEEMGLGVRVATPLAVESKLGGRILDSEGRLNGDQVWGKTAAWCDYAGPLNGSWCGMTVFTSPKNFRPSWSHARDYGFVAMNPFGLNAFTKADKREIVLKKGESLRITYAVAVHEHPQPADYHPQEVYERFVASEHSATDSRE